MMTQEEGTPAGWIIIDDIRQDLHGFEASTKSEEKLYAKGLGKFGGMEYPFSGGARLSTGAFELILERFETSKLSNPP